MFNQLDMVLKLLPEYAERAASKLRASGEHDALSNGPFNPTTDRSSCCLVTLNGSRDRSVKLHVRRVPKPDSMKAQSGQNRSSSAERCELLNLPT